MTSSNSNSWAGKLSSTDHSLASRVKDGDQDAAHVLYKRYVSLTIAEGRARCDQDSEDVAAGDASVSGFLHFPMPRNEAENQLFYDILGGGFLDITEILPSTSPRSWVYRDGSPVTWFKWFTGEPNHPNKEKHVEIYLQKEKTRST